MKWLLRLYPREWRDRYEDEMLALLEDCKITPHTIMDLMIGALDANLNYSDVTEGASAMVIRLRSSVVMVFCSFMLFGVGWGLLQRMTDPLPNFSHANQLYPSLGVLFHAIFVVGCVTFLAFLAGGVPVIVMAVRRAFEHKQSVVIRRFYTALACLLIFLLSTLALFLWHPTQHIAVIFTGYLILTATLLVLGTIVVSQLVARADFQASDLRWVYVPEVIILFCMLVGVVLATLFIVSITLHAPELFQSQDVSSPMFVTGLLFMALGAIFCGMGLRRTSVSR